MPSSRALQSLVSAPDSTVRLRPPQAVADVPVALMEELWETVPEFELRFALAEGAPGPPGWNKDFHKRGYLDYEMTAGDWKLRHR